MKSESYRELRILIVEDDSLEYERLKEVLVSSGVAEDHVFHTDEVSKIPKSIDQHQVEICFVSDLKPSSLGVDLIAELSISYPRVPCVLLVDGPVTSELEHEATSAGAYECLAKADVNPTLLKCCIRYAFKHARQLALLVEERHRIEEVIIGAPLPVIMFDADGKLLSLSDEFTKITGYTKEDLGDLQKCVDLVIQTDAAHPDWRSIFLPDAPSDLVTICSADDQLRLWQLKTVRIGADATGVPIFSAMAADVTDLTSALNAAEEANQAKLDFLEVISHDFRTPLSPIVGYTEIMLEDVRDPSHQVMLKAISESGRKLHHIIGDVLDFHLFDNEHIEYLRESFALKDLMKQLKEYGDSMYASDEVPLVLDMSDCHSACLTADLIGDTVHLCQIFDQLFQHAFKCATSGSVILRLKCSPCPEEGKVHVCFEIESPSEGIDASELAKVFEPMYHREHSFTGIQSGSGVGLAICKKLATAMGFDIGVRSGDDQNSIYYFTSDLECAPASDVSEIGDISEIGDGSDIGEISDAGDVFDVLAPEESSLVLGSEIMLVEDVAMNREYAKAIFKHLGIQLVMAEDGLEAIEMFKQSPERYGLILMDLHLPKCSGLEASVEIRKMNAYGEQVPIVAVTANASHKTEIATREAGMNDFLNKPYRPSQMSEILSKWMPSAKVETPVASSR